MGYLSALAAEEGSALRMPCPGRPANGTEGPLVPEKLAAEWARKPSVLLILPLLKIIIVHNWLQGIGTKSYQNSSPMNRLLLL